MSVNPRGQRRSGAVRALASWALLAGLAGLGGLAGCGSPHRAATSATTTSVGASSTASVTTSTAVSSTGPTGPTGPSATGPSATGPTATTAVATTRPGGSTTTTAGPASGCVNSTDAKCGPFYWNPPPAPNQPLTLTVTFTPASPHVGDLVAFTVTYADPDAGRPPLGCSTESQSYGDGSPAVRRVCDDASTCTWTGAHTPLPAAGGRWNVTYQHRYAQAGTFVADFSGTSRLAGAQAHCADSKTGRSGDPFASTGSASVTVSVSR